MARGALCRVSAGSAGAYNDGMRSWRGLEERVGLDALPAFHRAFLAWRGIDAADMPLRRVGQRVEAELNRLVQEGKAERVEGDWTLKPGALDGFGAAQPHLG